MARTHEQLIRSLRVLFSYVGTKNAASFCYSIDHDELVHLHGMLSERDRLAAENAELTATLDRLREVVPDNSGAWCEECCACVELGGEYATCMVCGEMPDDESSATWLMNKLQAILYPPETNHDHK